MWRTLSDGAQPAGRGVFARRAFAYGEFIFPRRRTQVLRSDELDQATEWDRIHLCELGFDPLAESCDLPLAGVIALRGDRLATEMASRQRSAASSSIGCLCARNGYCNVVTDEE
jgi:hypothetical protein